MKKTAAKRITILWKTCFINYTINITHICILFSQDLWIPYFNITTDITASSMRVHTDGVFFTTSSLFYLPHILPAAHPTHISPPNHLFHPTSSLPYFLILPIYLLILLPPYPTFLSYLLHILPPPYPTSSSSYLLFILPHPTHSTASSFLLLLPTHPTSSSFYPLLILAPSLSCLILPIPSPQPVSSFYLLVAESPQLLFLTNKACLVLV